MAINHLNTLAQYHTNYMFKVVLSREHELFTMKLNTSKPYINSLAHLSLSIWRKISHPSKKIVLPYKNVLAYPYQWKKNIFWLIPKATDILQKERRVCPTVFSDMDRENSSRNSISLTKQNRQCFNSIRHSSDSERRNSKNRRSAK